MKTALLFLSLAVLAGEVRAAATKIIFTLSTTDVNGVATNQTRYYWVNRPAGLSTNTPVPVILQMSTAPTNTGHLANFDAKAAQAGFVAVTCSFEGNSLAVNWNNDDPRISGWEDYDYTDEVIRRVKLSDNCNDVFMTGLSKGGHMTFAYACERPAMLKAAAPVDEFTGLTSNIPQAPVPMIVLQGTQDSSVPYAMVKDSVDEWRAVDGVMSATAVTTYESSPLKPGNVTQATWRGGFGGAQMAFVTIATGTHTYPTSGTETGYDMASGMWPFFAQFLTSAQAAPKVVAQPVNNTQFNGWPASFWVAATGNAPLAYQWQKNGTNLPGATSNWFTAPPATPGDNGALFRAIVTNGSGSVTSAVATLTVSNAPVGPTITTAPTNVTALAGQPVVFSVVATGTGGLGYQWRKNGVIISGATAAPYTNNATITADSGATFSVVVTDSTGSTTNSGATLTVNPAPAAPIIIINPARVRVLTNQSGTFSVTASNATGYQWQKATPFVANGNSANVPGATGSTYTIAAPTLANHATLYRCIVSNFAGTATSAHEFLMVTTNTRAPTDITSAATAAAQAGAPFSYTIVSSGGTIPISYITSPMPAGLSVNTNTGVISGTPAATGTNSIGLVASNSAGNTTATLVLSVTATVPPVPANAWRAARFGASATNPDIAGDTADPDGDGVKNLLEYFAGTDPLASALIGPKTNVVSLSGTNYLALTFTHDLTAGGATATVMVSSNLVTWLAGSSYTSTNASPPNTNTTEVGRSGSPVETIVVRDNVPVESTTRRVMRLRVTNGD